MTVVHASCNILSKRQDGERELVKLSSLDFAAVPFGLTATEHVTDLTTHCICSGTVVVFAYLVLVVLEIRK